MHFLGDTNNWTTRSLPNYLNDLPLEFFFRDLFLNYVVVIVFALFLPLSVFVFAILEQKKSKFIERNGINKNRSDLSLTDLAHIASFTHIAKEKPNFAPCFARFSTFEKFA